MKRNAPITVLALAATLALSFPSLAVEPGKPGVGPGDGGRPPMDEAKRQEMQQKIKERILDHNYARIKILQATQSCVQAAASMDAMKSCHDQERNQVKGLMQKQRSEREAMKAQRDERQGQPSGAGPREARGL